MATLVVGVQLMSTDYVGVRGQQVEERHAYRLTDDLDYEVLEQAVFSPDGERVAFARRGPAKSAPPSALSPLVSERVLYDVWIQEAPDTPARNLTGLSPGGRAGGAWRPQWSPRGDYLSFFAAQGAGVTLWAWSRTTNRISQLSPKNIDPSKACEWIGSVQMLCLGAASDERNSPIDIEGFPSDEGVLALRATAAWARAARGELTASVLDSLQFEPDKRHVYLIDAAHRSTRVIGATTQVFWQAGGGPWWTSPDGATVAVVSPTPSPFGSGSLARLDHPRTIELCSVNRQSSYLKLPLPAQVLTTTLSWSPDSRELAFFAYGDRPVNPLVVYGTQAVETMPEYLAAPRMPVENPARLYRVDVSRGTVKEVTTGDLDLGWLGAPAVMWTNQEELVLRATRKRGERAWNNVSRGSAARRAWLGPGPEYEWWVIDREGRTRTLTKELRAVPDALSTPDQGATFLGVVNGDVWRIDARNGQTTNLTDRFPPHVTQVKLPEALIGSQKDFWHTRPRAARPSTDRVLIQARRSSADAVGARALGAERDDYLLDLESRNVVLLPKPIPDAELADVSPASGQRVYTAEGPSGQSLWRMRNGRNPELILEVSTYRRHIITGERRLIEFTSLQGEKLKAVLILPVGYVPGRRYPLIASVYAGTTEGQVVGIMSPRATGKYHGLESAPSAGYVLLVPVMPRNVAGMDTEEGTSLITVSGVVLPAVEQAIASGVADPDRLFLDGHSFGGWTVASLLATTTRFKAAVGRSGMYMYPLFGADGPLRSGVSQRFRDIPHDWAMPTVVIKTYFPTDLPWWRDLTRLERNTPLFYADRIHTPLLLMHGDLDPVEIEQSEAMFGALVSMRKRAQLVRYWGEGHLLKVPANRRDSWQREFAWFEDFGDILRDSDGNLVFDGDRVKSRGGAPALKPSDFARFGPAAAPVSVARTPNTSTGSPH